jgi:hypothetical protein
LDQIYAQPHDSSKWLEHRVRVQVTAAFTDTFFEEVRGTTSSAADLSCGDGTLIRSLLKVHTRYMGDYAPGYEFCGPIEETIHKIPDVDLFLCTETLEHLDDPLIVLKWIRTKSYRLVLSTPIDAWDDVRNPEHYWAWDREYVEYLLQEAGYHVSAFMALDFRPISPVCYCFGVWGCVRA